MAEKNSTTRTWQIDTIDELKAFRNDVNGGTSYKGWTITLGADIDLNNETWTPIGNLTNNFQGTFDGGEFTISNLKVDTTSAYAGFFGYLDSAVVKDLTFENVDISGGNYTGTVAGYTTAANGTCQISGVTVTGTVTVTGGAAVGGIIGGGDAALNDVTVNATGEGSLITGKSGDVGGIAGLVKDDGKTYETGSQFSGISSNIDVKGEGDGINSVGGIFGSVGDGVEVNGITSEGGAVTSANVSPENQNAIGGITGVYGSEVVFTDVDISEKNDNYFVGIFNGSGSAVVTIDSENPIEVNEGDANFSNIVLTAPQLEVAEGIELTIGENASVDFEETVIAGTFNAVDANGVDLGAITLNGTLNLDADSTVKGTTVELGENAVINLDVSDFQGGLKKVLDLTADGSLSGKVNVTGLGENASVFFEEDGDVILSDGDSTVICLTSDAADKANGDVLEADGKKFYVGFNAFADADDAVSAAALYGNVNTFYIKGEYTVDSFFTAPVRDFAFLAQEEGAAASLTIGGATYATGTYCKLISGNFTVGAGVTLDIAPDRTTQNFAAFGGADAENSSVWTIDGTFIYGGGDFANVEINVSETGKFLSYGSDNTSFNGNVTLNVTGTGTAEEKMADVQFRGGNWTGFNGCVVNFTGTNVEIEGVNSNNNGGATFNGEGLATITNSVVSMYIDADADEKVYGVLAFDKEMVITDSDIYAGDLNVLNDNIRIAGGSLNLVAGSGFAGDFRYVSTGALKIAEGTALDIAGVEINAADAVVNNGRIDIVGDTDGVNAEIKGGIIAIQNGAVFTSAADVDAKLIYVGYDYAAAADSAESALVVAAGTTVKGADAIYVRTGSTMAIDGTASAGEFYLKGDTSVAADGIMYVAGTQGIRVREDAQLTVNGDVIWDLNLSEINNAGLKIEQGIVTVDGGKLSESEASAAGTAEIIISEGSSLSVLNGGRVNLDSVTNAGTIYLDETARITAETLESTGSIIVDAEGFDGINKIIDLNGTTSLEGLVTFENLAEGVNVYYSADGDVTLSSIAVDTFYVDSSFEGEFTDPVAEGKYYGINAFASFTEALKKVDGATSKIVIADGSVEEFPDENISVALSQDLTISGGKFTWNDDSAALFYVSFVKAADAADDVTVNFSDLAFDSVSPTEGKKTYVTFEFGALDNADTAVKAVVGADTTLNLSSFVVREGSSLEVEAGGRIITHTEVARIEGTLSVKGEDGFTIDGATADAAQYAKYLRAFGTGSVEIANNYLGVYDYIQLNGGSTFTADNSLITIGADAAGVWHYNPVSNGFGKLDVKAGSEFTLENGSVLKASANIVNAGVINVSGSTLLADGALVSGDVIKAPQNKGVFTNNGTVELSGESKAVIRELAGEGAFNVAGTAELDIANLASGTVTVKDGATLKDSSVAGAGTVSFAADSTVTFEGANAITAAIDGSVENFDLVVSEGASLLISRYTLAYGRDITVNGTIENAMLLTAEDVAGMTASLKANSSSGFSLNGWGTSVLTVNDAYIDLGNTSLKAGATGTFTWEFNNAYIKAASFLNGNAAGEGGSLDVTFTGSVLDANYLKNGAGVTVSFTEGSYAGVNSLGVNGVLNIDATSEVKVAAYQNNKKGGLEEHGDITGSLNVAGLLDINTAGYVADVELWGAKADVSGTLQLNKHNLVLDADSELTVSGTVTTTGTVTNAGSMTINNGTVTAGAFDLTGTLTINAGEGFDGIRKVVDVTGATPSEYDTALISLNGDVKLAIGDDGDIFIHNADMTTFYVDATYSGAFGDEVAEDQYLGINAFNSFATALDSKTEETKTFVVNTDVADGLSNKTITGSIVTENADGVTIADSLNNSYVNMTGVTVGENVTLDAKYFYLYGSNTINGDVKSSTTFYNSGKLTVNGKADLYTTMSRYYVAAEDGIYVVGTAAAGKGAEAEVQYLSKNYLGHYSGTFSVKDTAAEFGYILLNGDTDSEGYSQAQLVLDNARVSTIGGPNTQPGQVQMNDDAAIIATNNSLLDFVGPKDYAYLSMGENNSISLTDSEMRLGKEGQGTNNINGTITMASSTLSSLGTINVGATGSITTSDSDAEDGINEITAVKINNQGTISVGGMTTLNIGTLEGNAIEIADGAVIVNSTVGGNLSVEGNVTFRGDNTFNMIYDFGTAYTPNQKWTVEAGASVNLTSTDKYGLGYGDNVSINGELLDAKEAWETGLAKEDASFNAVGGVIAMTNAGFAETTSYFTVEDAYVRIGMDAADKAFNNRVKTDGASGTYIYSFSNSVLEVNSFNFQETEGLGNGNYHFTFTDSVLVAGPLNTNDKDSSFTFDNTDVTASNASTNGGDLSFVNGTNAVYENVLTNNGSLTIDAASTLAAAGIAGEGTITIDAANFEGGLKKIIDLSGTESLEGKVSFVNKADGINDIYGADGDVYLTDATRETIYVGADYADQAVGTVVNDHIVGFNAFADMSDAMNAVTESVTDINVTGDTVITGVNGVFEGWGNDAGVVSLYDIAGKTVNWKADEAVTIDVQSRHVVLHGEGTLNIGENVTIDYSPATGAGLGESLFAIGSFWTGDDATAKSTVNLDGDIVVGDVALSADNGSVKVRHGMLNVSATGSIDADYSIRVRDGELNVTGSGKDAAAAQLKSQRLELHGDASGAASAYIKDSYISISYGSGRIADRFDNNADGLGYAKNFTFENSRVESGSLLLTDAVTTFAGIGTDFTFTNVTTAGIITLDNSNFTASRVVTNTGSITIDADSCFTAAGITGEGTITIDAADFTTGIAKIIDLAGTESLEGKVSFVNKADGINAIYGNDGDVYLTDATCETIYVGADYADQSVGTVVNGNIVGFNAFATLNDVVLGEDTVTLNIAGGTYSRPEGVFNNTASIIGGAVTNVTATGDVIIDKGSLVFASEVAGTVNITGNFQTTDYIRYTGTWGVDWTEVQNGHIRFVGGDETVFNLDGTFTAAENIQFIGGSVVISEDSLLSNDPTHWGQYLINGANVTNYGSMSLELDAVNGSAMNILGGGSLTLSGENASLNINMKEGGAANKDINVTNGSLIVENGAKLTATGAVTVAANGSVKVDNAEIDVEVLTNNGEIVVSGSSIVNADLGGSGSVLFDGAKLTGSAINKGNLTVKGENTFTGTLNASYVYVGDWAGQEYSGSIDFGTGSAVNVGGQMIIGYDSTVAGANKVVFGDITGTTMTEGVFKASDVSVRRDGSLVIANTTGDNKINTMNVMGSVVIDNAKLSGEVQIGNSSEDIEAVMTVQNGAVVDLGGSSNSVVVLGKNNGGTMNVDNATVNIKRCGAGASYKEVPADTFVIGYNGGKGELNLTNNAQFNVIDYNGDQEGGKGNLQLNEGSTISVASGASLNVAGTLENNAQVTIDGGNLTAEKFINMGSIEVKGGAFAADELQMVYGTYSFEGLTAGTEDRTISISIQAVGSDADPVTIDYTLAAGATTVSGILDKYAAGDYEITIADPANFYSVRQTVTVSGGTFDVTGSAELNIGKLMGGYVALNDNGVLSGSVAGGVGVYGTTGAIKDAAVSILSVGYGVENYAEEKVAVSVTGKNTIFALYVDNSSTFNAGVADGERTELDSDLGSIAENSALNLVNTDMEVSSFTFNGKVTLDNSVIVGTTLTVSSGLNLTLDSDSVIKFETLNVGEGASLNVTLADYSGLAIFKVLDYTADSGFDSSVYDNVTVVNEGYTLKVIENDLYAVSDSFDVADLTMSTSWTGAAQYETVAPGMVYGVNAYSSFGELPQGVEKLSIVKSEGNVGAYTFTYPCVELFVVDSDITADLTMTGAEVNIAEGSTLGGSITAVDGIHIYGAGTVGDVSGNGRFDGEGISAANISGFQSIYTDELTALSITLTDGSDTLNVKENLTVEGAIDFGMGIIDEMVLAENATVTAGVINTVGAMSVTIDLGGAYKGEAAITVTENGIFASGDLVLNLDLVNATLGDTNILVSGITEFKGTLVYSNVEYALDDTLKFAGKDYTITLENNALVLNAAGVSSSVKSDVDGNGYSDIVMLHEAGFSGAWLTQSNGSKVVWADLADKAENVELLGMGKANGSAALFFHNTENNYVGAWTLEGGKVTGYTDIDTFNPSAEVIGLGDFNGDGATDVLLRDNNEVGAHITGTGWTDYAGLGDNWEITAVGDFNADGKDDIVLVDKQGNHSGMWLMRTEANDEGNLFDWSALDTLSDGLEIVGAGDVNGDGCDDVLISKGEWLGAWIIEDGVLTGFQSISDKYAGTIEGVGDFNGDGIDDIQIRVGQDAIGYLVISAEGNAKWQQLGQDGLGEEWTTKFSAIC